MQHKESEWAENRKRFQRACPHQDSKGRWVFNIVHNFPDSLPRGLCPLCVSLIQPRHEESGGPNQTIIVEEHPLYPVVRWMEHLDYTLAKLEQEYLLQKIDSALASSHSMRLIPDIESAYLRDRIAAHQTFDKNTQQYKASLSEKRV